MGNINSIQKISFQELQDYIKVGMKDTILINTLPENYQYCLIINTINASNEVNLINELLKSNKKKKIIIYGKNHSDVTIYKKYNQLQSLGFKNVYIYIGGIFEWLCLQEIYGKDLFKTTGNELDILKYT